MNPSVFNTSNLFDVMNLFAQSGIKFNYGTAERQPTKDLPEGYCSWSWVSLPMKIKNDRA